jgi:hypothetical protein
MKTAIKLAGAIGIVVDGLLVGLVKERGHQVSRRDYASQRRRALAPPRAKCCDP